MTSDRIHFKGLNAVRFLAAAVVAISHASVLLMWSGLPSLMGWVNSESGTFGWLNPESGKLAVICFFVLSGFLITYLLLAEEARTGAISVRAFYLRRILRIWPLYYLLVLCGFLLLPHVSLLESPMPPVHEHSWWLEFALYMTIFPNLAIPVPYLGHLWSIGVEEQFYILWPILLVLFPNRMRLLLGVITLYLITLFASDLFPFAHAQRLKVALSLFRIDCIAIGGVAAVVLFRGTQPLLQIVAAPATQILTAVALAVVYLWNLQVPRLTYDLYALLFGVLILGIAAEPRSVAWLENRVFDLLGKVSYGIYMYHPVAILLTLAMLRHWFGAERRGWPFSAALYGLGLASTVAIAVVSYYGFEVRFLRLKLRVSTIVTGDLAKESGTPAVATILAHTRAQISTSGE